MKDGIIKGSGNSRYLRTVANALTLYPNYESFIAALIQGTFPIDLNGINSSGWSAVGTKLNKAALLTDSLCSALGLSTAATPNQAMDKLRQLINTANSNADGRTKTQIVSYRGTDTYGESDPSSVTFSFAPEVVIFLGNGLQLKDGSYNWESMTEINDGYTRYANGISSIMISSMLTASFAKGLGFGYMYGSDYNAYKKYGKKSTDGKTFSWYATDIAFSQLNDSAYNYYFLGIG
ncbi:hypothetical protein D1641_01280 [Colidextribacter sp. OB.20]|uniref:hypothetical protein n=1 Tax=Colidextribacter sp. OB.20 TaxID=2304568 RepID=UPI0013684EFF|nr:hypothetical protein [Colidextribacter sp. OB.20]NBI08652.1 hypothetical protein [Colidextribacter sp. OB.20]